MIETEQRLERAGDRLAGREGHGLPAASKMGGRDTAGSGSLALGRSEEHTSELQSLMRISYAVFCLKKKKQLRTTIRVKVRRNKLTVRLIRIRRLSMLIVSSTLSLI